MDFIERLFGIAPDAGTGFLELALVLSIAGVVTWLVIRRMTRKSRTPVRILSRAEACAKTHQS